MKLKVVCRKDITYKNNTSPLFIRLTHDRKTKYVSLGVSVVPQYWNDAEQQITNAEDRKRFQHLIDAKVADMEKMIKRLEALEVEVTFESLLDKKSRKAPNQTVAEYFDKLIEMFEKAGKINTASKYYFCFSSLKKFRPMDITFNKIDSNFLTDFERFLAESGNSANTIATKFATLKSAYNKALEDGIFSAKENPFVRFKVGKLWSKTRKRAITKEDVLRLKNMELPNDSRFGYMELARDIFLFSYYTAGINFKDMATLRFCDIKNGRVYYSRHKTGKDISCQLLPEAQYIIEKYSNCEHSEMDYIFPILDRREHKTEQQIFNRVHKVLVKVNRNLKILSGMIGLRTPLTTYVARHTFATALKRSGVNVAIISESLGHSDLSTTQIYLDSFENSQIDEAMRNLL